MKQSEVGIRQFYLANGLYESLRATRKEPGLPLSKVATLMMNVFDSAEIDSIFGHIQAKRKKDSLWTKIKVNALLLF